LSQLGGLVGLLAAVALASVVYTGLLLVLGVSEVRAIATLARDRLSA
jgi:hypothetical protein